MTDPGTADALFDAALVEEAAKKSALVWIAVPGHAARPVWHVWHDGAVLVLQQRTGGGVEQHLPGLAEAAAVEVTVRSKDKGGRLVAWAADVAVLAPGATAWDAAVAALHGERLNAHDGDAQPDRWARDCVIVRIGPARAIAHGAGLPAGSQAAAPVPSPAKTRGAAPRNYSFGKRLRGR
ncbi:hypothetical protein GCM10023205_30260 [Yinghuangia aomiensis]|uniref:Pyridoxamine 5'-phosphate oxidase n=1 Tax=Yinghuangia aomiensis TaxID=676205 RepID=A0ABP9H918_9ACTN